MNIVFLDAGTVGEVPNWQTLTELGEFTAYPITQAHEVAERVKNADIIITNKVMIDDAIMAQTPSLKLVCVAATGMNNIDLEAAEKRGITVKNAVGYSSCSVAQWTFTMLLYLMSRPDKYAQHVLSGDYAASGMFTYVGIDFHELAGKTYGIIGLGNIGRRVAKIATAFGAKVIYYSTSGKNNTADYERVELNELLQTSDIISIHAPLNEKTKGLIGYKEIKQMKESAYLINVGRGGIVIEQDLTLALDEKLIAGAGLDVLEKEPISSENPLLNLRDPDRLFISPHMAWTSVEAREQLVEQIIENIHLVCGNTGLYF